MRSKEVDQVERNKCIEIFKEKVKRYDASVEIKGVSVGEEMRILDTVVDYIEELESDNYACNNIINEQIDLLKNSIDKQVIRDKIKELYEDNYAECIEFNLEVIEILNELLEGE